MRPALRAAAAAALLAATMAQAAMAAPTGCQPQALKDLERLSPQGYSVYRDMSDKSIFLRFLTCDDVLLGLTTAVHESVHMLTSEKNAYPLIEGGVAERPSEALRFFAPRRIAGKFDASDIYVETYLMPGSASSADDFRYLLDELNAYSHDLASAVQLKSLQRPENGEVGHRDGLAALMAFVMAYVDTAREKAPATWATLQRPEVRKTVRTLWTQAETALAASCDLPGFGQEDRKPIAFLSDPENGGGLAELIGRAPIRPCQGTTAARNS